MQPLALVRDAFVEPPEMDTAVSHAILRRVSQGELPATLRLHRPGRVVAFGPRDRVLPGFPAAVRAARDGGFGAVERLAGGRAAIFHEGTIAFSWITPDPSPREAIRARFDATTAILLEAMRELGVDARVGEVPGEYCPGDDSINARGATKIVGIGQRVIARAAHVGGVIVVGGSALVREALVPVYAALGLDWDPATTGAIEDEVPGVTWDEAEAAVAAAFGRRFDLAEAETEPATLARAESLIPRHRVTDPDQGDVPGARQE